MEDIEPHLKYIVSVLTERLNSDDLEGIEGLPEQLVPNPSLKPQFVHKLVEDSEFVREQLLSLVSTLVECVSADSMRLHIDNFVSLIRTLVMDPASEIQCGGCKLLSLFVINFKELVFHFTELLGRSLLLPLTSKKSKIKIAALQALQDLLYCGTWKYTVPVFDVLVGFRDPNVVPVRDFFEPTNRFNYLALFVNHKNVAVREAFIRFVGDLLVSLPDRWDIQGRLLAYLLSGHFDEFEEIRVNI